MSAHRHTSALTPISRTGIHGLRGFILFVALIITSCTPSLTLASLTGHSPLPTSAAEALSVAALCLIGFCLTLRRSKAKGLLPLLIAVGLLITLYARSILPAAALISFIFVISEGALLLAVADCKQLLVIPCLPLLTFALSVLAGGRLFYGVIGLIPYLPLTALALATRKAAEKKDGLTRVGIICLTSAALGLSLLAATSYVIYTVYGSLELSFLASLIEQTREAVITMLNELAAQAGGTLANTMTPEFITGTVDELFLLLPAYGVLTCNIAAAFAQMMFLSELSDFCDPMSDRLRMFRISTVSCVVFVVGYIMMLFSATDTVSVTTAVVENLILVLTPALAWAGILHISFNLARRGSRSGCAPLLVMLVPCLLFVAPWIPAFYEAFYNIATPIRRRKKPPTDKT